MSRKPRCKYLILDAGPLLSLSPLRGLAEVYLTVPQVLTELKDKRAREHFEQLGLNAGVRVEVREPDPANLTHVISWAKKTGDYSVLSHADLCVIALTYAMTEHEKVNSTGSLQQVAEITSKASNTQQETGVDPRPAEQIKAAQTEDQPQDANKLSSLAGSLTEKAGIQYFTATTPATEEHLEIVGHDGQLEPLDVEIEPIRDPVQTRCESALQSTTSLAKGIGQDSTVPLYDDPSDSDDGEGEWITPGSVALHKSRALDLLPKEGVMNTRRKGKSERDDCMVVGCMTADFAMQNVIFQMGLNLVSVDGKRIEKVKSWVLRCHACFKICKDASKQFCPSCGNPTLLRASVTITSPTASPDTPAMQVHLKANFQYKLRGTKYPIPSPKPGSAKTGSGEGLILREDQSEYLRARREAEGKRERQEKKIMKGAIDRGMNGTIGVGSWMDPDWVPEILSVGTGGKGRTKGSSGGMPIIGYGRNNPNERRKK